ncbi:hypothetical protein [Novipirellula galeiformis]|uniref:hypothetical protein n=1 Tax=Novipirellula galeiformis TaxID=2528004 RepID=UPI0011B4B24F|nr:hypothetical protein [Novipirellula galeiformis]
MPYRPSNDGNLELDIAVANGGSGHMGHVRHLGHDVGSVPALMTGLFGSGSSSSPSPSFTTTTSTLLVCCWCGSHNLVDEHDGIRCGSCQRMVWSDTGASLTRCDFIGYFNGSMEYDP